MKNSAINFFGLFSNLKSERRANNFLKSMVKKESSSVLSVSRNWADTMGNYRMLDNKSIELDDIKQGVIQKIKNRMLSLGMDISKHTLVFDRGNNSKKNFRIIKDLGLYYVGALTPYHNQFLIEKAIEHFQKINMNNIPLYAFRDQVEIWDEKRTVLVFISDRLKTGQLRGIYQALAKKEKQLKKLQEFLLNPRAKSRERKKLEEKITSIAKGQFLKDIIDWSLEKTGKGKFKLHYKIDQQKIS